ncbi:reverse transcriptase domain-containing protein [Tanacetum coccineum]
MLRQPHYSKYTKALSESEDIGGGHWKLRSRKQKSRNARVWFDDLPSESIDSYDNLKKAFLENYLQQKKCIKDPIELHNIKQRDGESTEDFVRRYKLESRDVKGASECMRIFGFVHGITNPELIKRLHDKIPKMVDEMIRVTTSFLRGEVAASNHERKKSFPPWKQQEGETSRKDKALTILMVQPWERVARQRITQRFSSNPEILFPSLGEDEGTEGPMIIEAEIGGHCIHLMYVDGSSASEILYEHCFSRLRPEIKNQLAPATTSLIGFNRVRKLQTVSSIAYGMLKILVEGGVITLKSSRMVPLECAVVSGQEGNPSATKQAVEERVKVEINLEHPKQTEGCSTVRQKNRGQAADQNQAIQEEVRKLVEAGIMKEVHYHDWLSNPMMSPVPKMLKRRAKVEQKTRKTEQIAEAKEAFKQMKQLIAELPMLTALMEKEELIVYLAAAKETISAVLMTEREAKQMPIYFVSRALRGPEINYTSMEKLVMALEHASKRLKRYFQAHPIKVIIDQPIQQVLSRPKVAGRLQKWSIKLGEYTIHYRPRVSVKGQILADFIVKRLEEDSPDTLMEEEKKFPEPWILFMDGSSCTNGFGAGLIRTNPEGMKFTYALRFRFDATNNKVEYKALIAGLQIADQMGVKNLQANVDSRLKSFIGPWLRYVGPLQANYVLREIPEGSCSMHTGTRSVVAKALRIGYYWPTMHKDARTLIRACQECQVHKPVPRNPQQKLTPTMSSWPFYKWGIDIAGPFSKGPGKVKFLIVAINYFTKWIEAKPVAIITGNQIKKFVWDNIVCRFGLPGEIISDNGKQFQDNPFKDWCEKLCIRQHFASVKHPQTNGLVERENRSLGEGIKARLGKKNTN